MRPAPRLLLLPASILFAAGCAADRPLTVRIAEGLARPDPAVLVFFIDGFGREQFDAALAEGRLPNIRAHLLERGILVEHAFASIPSITYANSVTFLTGLHPGHHGVVSNKWYDPRTDQYQNYGFIRSYQRVDDDYPAAPTIHEIIRPRVSVSIQAAQRRGATHTIDNWATSGINWFFGNYTGVDCLVAQGFELVGRRASWWGRWPDFIFAYFPGVDHVGHHHGWRHPAYARAVDNVDRQIGRICQGLRDVGMYDRTVLCLVSDHGVVNVRHDNVFDIAAHVADHTGGRVWKNVDIIADGPAAKGYHYVVACSGSRWTAVHGLRGIAEGAANDLHAARDAINRTLADGGGITTIVDKLPGCLPAWLRLALEHPAVELAALPLAPGRILALQRDRAALIIRDRTDDRTRHRVVQIPGREIISPAAIPDTVPDTLPSDHRAWLVRSSDDRYPDLVPQLACLFDSPRAGDVAFFAAADWDFSTNDPGGGHGSILRADVCVPMLFAGPRLPQGVAIPIARNCDLMPTVLGLLGVPPIDGHGRALNLDGVDLFAELMPSEP